MTKALRAAAPIVVSLCFSIFVIFSAPNAKAAGDEFADGAQKFIQSLADSAISSMSAQKDAAARKRDLRQLFTDHFDVKTIGKWALGRYWRLASAAERAQYLSVFEDFIITTYAHRFKDFTNQKISVTNAVGRSSKLAIVQSLILRETEGSIRVEWRVAYPGGKYKIVDIIVEGVSMVQTQRAQFSSVIRQNDGKITGLLTALQSKVDSLNADVK
ncbi:MAG: ABC transporter substrate-binding protein [Rhodospirillales bacterium]|nr:ABC transporter substrate-binding protein [Rhodospirillales bacterium]